MNRPLTVVFAALEALLVAGIGIGIALVPLSVMWAFQYGLQIDWIVFWRAAADTWMLGHGVDIALTLDPLTATSIGFPDASTPFVLTIAPLGFALLTLLLAYRAGRRIAETPHFILGLAVALASFGALSLTVVLTALHEFARPSIWQGALLPTLVFALGLALGGGIAIRRLTALQRAGTMRTDATVGAIATRIADIPGETAALIRASVTGGVAAVAAIVAAASVAVALLLLVNYAEVIALYESGHVGVLGGVALTIAQLAFLPNLVVWAVSWFVGPGFAIGAGSSIGPLGTSLGPVPAVPFLGALPTGDLAWGFLGLLVPVLAGFFAGLLVRSTLVRSIRMPVSVGRMLLAGLCIGVVAGMILGLLAWFSAGAAGPGRLVEVGPSPWLVALFATLEVGGAAALGLLSVRNRD
ncbi:cell division protein PerM [Homoserinimonas sp. A447]